MSTDWLRRYFVVSRSTNGHGFALGCAEGTLDSLGLTDNTIVVFTGDNGGVASGDAYATSNLPLRGGKGYQWEGGIREPLLIRPGDRFFHRTVDEPVTGANLYPTLVSLAGLDVKLTRPVEGVVLSPLLRGDTLTPRSLFWHYPHYGNQGGDRSSMIRRANWKLILYWVDGPDELYHLGGGAQENTDLAGEQAARVDELRTELLTFLADRGAAYPRPDPDYEPVRFRQRGIFHRDTLLPRLESQRRAMFREHWSPDAE